MNRRPTRKSRALAAFVLVLAFFVPSLLRGEAIDLKDGARTILYGGFYNEVPAQGDDLPWALATGDIDGDGYQDVITASIIADGPNNSRFSSGDAYILFGRPRASMDSLYDLSVNADVAIYGARYGDFLGWVAKCADIDGDSYDDVVLSSLGSFGPDSSRLNAGEIYVYWGRPRSEFQAVYDIRYEDPDVRIVGAGGGSPHIGGQFFDGVDGDRDGVALGLEVGDISGDGYADVIFSSIAGEGPGSPIASGLVYIVLGRPRCTMPPLIDCDYSTDDPHPDVRIHGADFGDLFGTSFTVGDLDGDGISDLFGSAYLGDGKDNLRISAGDVYGFWGRSEWDAVYDIGQGEFDLAFEGNDFARAGYRMAMGDLDGDGVEDLVFGSIGDIDDAAVPEERRGSGDYRIIFGRPKNTWPVWTDLATEVDVWILGAEGADTKSGGSFYTWGFSLATGDRDGDGRDDLLIGAGGADVVLPPAMTRIVAGSAYLLCGRPQASWPGFMDLRTDYDLIIYGAEGSGEGTGAFSWDALGRRCVMADLDGNGKDEIIVSAPFADGPNNFRPEAGETYVIYDDDTTRVVVGVPDRRVPAVATLHPNYPNPFNPATTFRFAAPIGSVTSLSIYDVYGREIAVPVRSEVMLCEVREVQWSARDDGGEQLPSGVYFVRLRVEGEVHSRKITIVR